MLCCTSFSKVQLWKAPRQLVIYVQLTHYTSRFKKKRFPITLICDTITNAPNIGSLFRTADAFGIEELIFCGKDIPIGRRMTKTSRSTEKHVVFRVEDNVSNVIEVLKETHYIIAIEITDKSQSLDKFQIETNKPIVIIVGNENYGISESILQQCDVALHIDMYGHNSSMNVVQATGIALFEITRQLKALNLS